VPWSKKFENRWFILYCRCFITEASTANDGVNCRLQQQAFIVRPETATRSIRSEQMGEIQRLTYTSTLRSIHTTRPDASNQFSCGRGQCELGITKCRLPVDELSFLHTE